MSQLQDMRSFVLNTKQEIYQTFDDYKNGKLGAIKQHL
jgi:redox-sensitive bicupin YhaK (pirin superfamily)